MVQTLRWYRVLSARRAELELSSGELIGVPRGVPTSTWGYSSISIGGYVVCWGVVGSLAGFVVGAMVSVSTLSACALSLSTL